MKYYFNVRDGDRVTFDPEGQDLAGIEKAWMEAAGSIADILRDTFIRPAGKPDGRRLGIEVCDDTGPVLSVSVSFRSGTQGH